MTYLLGTDEAGYGPNLGPLVVTGTLWHVPDLLSLSELRERLSSVAKVAAGRGKDEQVSITIADSKSVYQPGGGLRRLEQGVLAALTLTRARPATWQELWSHLDADSELDRRSVPWYTDFDLAVPVDNSQEEIQRSARFLESILNRHQMTICSMRSTTLYPRRLNQLIEALGSKGEVLSQVSLDLVRRILEKITDESVLIVCDKHGGRNKYGALLQRIFPDQMVEVYHEGREESLYRVGPRQRRIEIRFRARGEQFLPSALASMTSKYLRDRQYPASLALQRYLV